MQKSIQIVKVRHSGGKKLTSAEARRSERGCREGGEGLKTLRVMQKSAENCKELGIEQLLQEFCGMLKLISHALLLAEARGGGFKREARTPPGHII